MKLSLFYGVQERIADKCSTICALIPIHLFHVGWWRIKVQCHYSGSSLRASQQGSPIAPLRYQLSVWAYRSFPDARIHRRQRVHTSIAINVPTKSSCTSSLDDLALVLFQGTDGMWSTLNHTIRENIFVSAIFHQDEMEWYLQMDKPLHLHLDQYNQPADPQQSDQRRIPNNDHKIEHSCKFWLAIGHYSKRTVCTIYLYFWINWIHSRLHREAVCL